MAELIVQTESRKEFGKNVSRRLRATGRIPGVVYGSGFETVHISIDPAEVIKILQSESGHNTIFKLKFEDQLADVLIRDLQLDPLKGSLIHADFQTVAMDEVMEFQVPVDIQGTALGVKNEGGILDVVMREIEVECLPGEVPDSIAVDVSELEIGDAVRVSELEVDEKVKILSDSELVVAHVVPPRAEIEEEELEEEELEEGVEPEVIRKGKAEEEAEAEAASEEAPE
jgi:large subunit ribosomal protein L25